MGSSKAGIRYAILNRFTATIWLVVILSVLAVLVELDGGAVESVETDSPTGRSEG